MMNHQAAAITEARVAYVEAIEAANAAEIAATQARKDAEAAQARLDDAARAYYDTCYAMGRDPGFPTAHQNAWQAGNDAHGLGYARDQVAPIFSTCGEAASWQDGWDAAHAEVNS